MSLLSAEEIGHLTVHRHWFTWPSWMFYAWWLEKQEEELMRDVLSGAYRL